MNIDDGSMAVLHNYAIVTFHSRTIPMICIQQS